MLYYTIKETEEARELTREFIKEYYAQLEDRKNKRQLKRTRYILKTGKFVRKGTNK